MRMDLRGGHSAFVRSADGGFGRRRCKFRALFRLYTITPQHSKFLLKENAMTIKVGDKLPAGKLWELPVEWFAGCPTGADEITVPDATRGKRIVMFGLPGAYTKT